jgi:hypothetical protein
MRGIEGDTFQHAQDCARRAKMAVSERERNDWLMLQQRYLALATSLEPRKRTLVSNHGSALVSNCERALKDLAGRSHDDSQRGDYTVRIYRRRLLRDY